MVVIILNLDKLIEISCRILSQAQDVSLNGSLNLEPIDLDIDLMIFWDDFFADCGSILSTHFLMGAPSYRV